jgi:LPXTG-site transpeptidase (sortase) family protein
MNTIPESLHKRINQVLSIVIVLSLLFTVNAQVFALSLFWNPPVTADSAGSVGYYSSLAVVNGMPAMSYYDSTNYSLKFVRARYANGSAWNTAQTLDSTGNVGQRSSLAMVNGVPAICYEDFTNGDLIFIRATNANGTAWNTPQIIDSGEWVGDFCSLAVVNGVPAISYFDTYQDNLKYVYATDANGSTWSSPQTLDSIGTVGAYTSLAVVNGSPAISYYDGTNDDLKFIRAMDASGAAWNTPQTLDSSGWVGQNTSLEVINGNPAISYYDHTHADLKFIRATDPSGTTWNSPQTLDSTGSVGELTSLVLIGGMPAIAYLDVSSGAKIKYIVGADLNGTTWNAPEFIGNPAITSGTFPSLASVGGVAAISYYNGALQFIINNGTIGITAWDGSTQIDTGDTLAFGSTSLGNAITKTLTIRNTGTATLNLQSLVLPTGFSLTGTYSNEIAGGSTKEIQIRLDALQTGSFSGNLEISNNDKSLTPFTINLTGVVTNTDGEITISESGSEIVDGGSLDYGTTLIGSPLSRIFTITNSGAYDLNLYSLTLPDGFSLVGSYDHSVAPTASTTLTVRLDALAAGSYSGSFSLGNNDADENPYTFTLSGVVSDAPGEISVWNSVAEIPYGTGSLAFGSTQLGTPVSIALTIRNDGSYPLDLGTVSLPAGFSLAGSYDHSVAPTASTTLTVRLDALSAGSYNGTFSLPNDDTDENPFTFSISGTVTNLTLQTPLIAPVNGSTVLESQILVAFNQAALSDGSADAANNPDNYLLVEEGANNTFDTTSCLVGLAGDDVQVAVSSVTYDSTGYTALVNTGALPSGTYQLLVCGTASIEGLDGNVLNNGLFDSATRFTVVSASSSSGTSGGSSGSASVSLPSTGFAPGRVTLLPVQPLEAAYEEMDSLRLQIPGLKVDVPIVGVPQTSNGWDVTWLNTAQAGWLNGTAFPTWDGNTVITGHVTDANGNRGPFADLKTLKYGDEIVLQAYGETHRYEVRENKLVLPGNTSVVNEHKEQSWITLITCEYYYEDSGEYLYRRVVRAVLVEIE